MVAAYPTSDRQALQRGCDVGAFCVLPDPQEIQYVSGHLLDQGRRERLMEIRGKVIDQIG